VLARLECQSHLSPAALARAAAAPLGLRPGGPAGAGNRPARPRNQGQDQDRGAAGAPVELTWPWTARALVGSG
jgi:hypothetical protein